MTSSHVLQSSYPSSPSPSLSPPPPPSSRASHTPTPSNAFRFQYPPLKDPQDLKVSKEAVQVTTKLNEDGFIIPLTRSGKLFGLVTVPSGLIPVGWTILISPVSDEDLKKDTPSQHSECDTKSKKNHDKPEEQKFVSLAFDMKIKVCFRGI